MCEQPPSDGRTRLAANAATVLGKIRAAESRAGRPPGDARLIAVTKNVPASVVGLLPAVGVLDLGENRVQEAEGKIAEVGPGPRWHLIGHLQGNKARRALALFSWIHSLDSERLLLALDRIAAETPSTVVKGLVQVNVSGEDQKYGVSPDSVRALLAAASSAGNVEIRGLMGMAPFADDPEDARPAFRLLAGIREESNRAGWYRVPLTELSMGMSGDYEVAVEEGATLVRVGTALFTGVARVERDAASEGN